jgi:hypothetical protein
MWGCGLRPSKEVPRLPTGCSLPVHPTHKIKHELLKGKGHHDKKFSAATVGHLGGGWSLRW